MTRGIIVQNLRGSRLRALDINNMGTKCRFSTKFYFKYFTKDAILNYINTIKLPQRNGDLFIEQIKEIKWEKEFAEIVFEGQLLTS